MKALKTRKFFLDYLIGSGLIIAFIWVLVGNFTIMDTKGVLTLAQRCASSSLRQNILESTQLVLRKGEQCEIEVPCETYQSLRCEGTAKVADIPMQMFAKDLLIIRVTGQLNQYGVVGYSDKSTFRLPIGLIKFLLFYLAVLVEAGALLFALWRQKSLRQTFSLTQSTKIDQLLKPMLVGVLLAVVVVAVNYQVDRVFTYPNQEQARIKIEYFQTVAGVVLAILVAPLVEELIFRGVLLRFFVDRKQQLLGLLLTSALFAFLHVMSEEGLGWQLYKFAIYFLFSGVLCWSYIKQKNLWSPIILHGSYNATMVGFVNIFV